MPNFEVRVAVLMAAMVPTPTCGLMRMPITAVEPGCSRIAASTRSSSWKLSMLRVMPCRRAVAISPRVLAGESNTISSGGKPGCPGLRQLARARHLAGHALLAQRPQDALQAPGLGGEGVGEVIGKARREARHRLAHPAQVDEAREQDIAAEQPLRDGRLGDQRLALADRVVHAPAILLRGRRAEQEPLGRRVQRQRQAGAARVALAISDPAVLPARTKSMPP